MTTSTNYSMEDHALRFFGEIKNELGFTSTRKIVYLVRSVISQLRKNLSHDEVSNVLKRMPTLFQLLFISNWRYHEEESAKSHLDEIVEKVYQQGQRTEKALFTSEIETLNAVIVVLRKLDKLFRLLGVDILPYSLKQELKQVAVEDAA